MAFLAKNRVFVNALRSLGERNKMKYIFIARKTGMLKNEQRLLPVIQMRKFASENENKNVRLEKQEEKNVQIYKGSLTTQVRAIKVFTILSSTTGLLIQPMLYNKIVEIGPSAGIIGIGFFYGFFIFATPLLVHLLTKRYVTHVEYNPDDKKYMAYTYTFFLRRKKIEFTPDDVKAPATGAMFTTFVVKNIPLFVDPRMFYDPREYAKMMGYDKPIDFSLDSDSDDRKK